VASRLLLQQLFRSIVGPRFAAELVELGEPATVLLWPKTRFGTVAKRNAAMLFILYEMIHRDRSMVDTQTM
jgi:hypothetical protein